MLIGIFATFVYSRGSNFFAVENQPQLWKAWCSDSVIYGCLGASCLMQGHEFANQGSVNFLFQYSVIIVIYTSDISRQVQGGLIPTWAEIELEKLINRGCWLRQY